MNRFVSVVFRKELLDGLRDKRSLTTLLLMAFLMPFMLYGQLQFAISKSTKDEREETRILVRGGDQVPTLLAHLKQSGISIDSTDVSDEAAITEKLRDRKLTAVLDVDAGFAEAYQALRPAELRLWVDTSTEQGPKISKLRRLINQYNSGVAQWRLVARGVSPTLVTPVQLQEYDVASQGARSGAILGMMFGMLFWTVFSIGTTMIIDGTAGERERRTLELLLAQPVRVRDLVIGKWGAAVLLAFVGLIMEMTATHFALLQLPLEEIGMSWQLGLPRLALIILSGLPLCLFSAAFIMALALNTKSFKEAQATVGIAMIVPMLPVVIVPMLDLGKQTWMFAVPALGHGEVVKALTKGQEVLPVEWLLLIGVPLLLSLALIGFCMHRLRSERFVIGV